MGVVKYLKAPFKLIGKAFKFVGRQIRSGFNKLGRFMNKFGILGQIGMMWITGGISNAMFQGLSTLGTGFMQGLAAGGTMTETAHSILQGITKLAKVPYNLVGSTAKETWGTITKAVEGTVGDTISYLGNKLPFLGKPEKIQTKAEYFDSVLGRISTRFKEATSKVAKSTGEAMKDVKKFYGDMFEEGLLKPRNPQADYRRFEIPTGREKVAIDPVTRKEILDPVTGDPVMIPEMKEVIREIASDTRNREAFEEYKQTQFEMDTEAHRATTLDLDILDPEGVTPVRLEERPATMGTRLQQSVMAGDAVRYDPETNQWISDPSYIEEVFNEGLMGKTSPLRSERAGEAYMEGAPERRASLLEAEAATDYSNIPTPEGFEKRTKRMPEGTLLQRTGATFMDEFKDWFTSPGKYFGAAAGAMGARLLQPAPLQPLHTRREPGTGFIAQSRSKELGQVYTAMSERQPRPEGYRLPLMDPTSLYAGIEEESIREGNTGMAFGFPHSSQRFAPPGFGRVS